MNSERERYVVTTRPLAPRYEPLRVGPALESWGILGLSAAATGNWPGFVRKAALSLATRWARRRMKKIVHPGGETVAVPPPRKIKPVAVPIRGVAAEVYDGSELLHPGRRHRIDREATQAVDRYVKSNQWRAVGVAAGSAFVLGALARRLAK